MSDETTYEKTVDGLLTETISQDPVVITYSKADVSEALALAEAAVVVKEAELQGAKDEVVRFETLLDKCTELDIAEAADSAKSI